MCSGFGIVNSEIEMDSPFELDSIQYSSGISNYIVSGKMFFKGKERSFAVMSSESPSSKAFEIQQSTFPLRSIDSSKFECVLTFRKGVCEISWRKDAKFLYLRNSII
ncbi:MAG: hypothetical protein ACJASQ_000609 [Crocinitomicaceae bacterium]|jgi:hypothetical protein